MNIKKRMIKKMFDVIVYGVIGAIAGFIIGFISAMYLC